MSDRGNSDRGKGGGLWKVFDRGRYGDMIRSYVEIDDASKKRLEAQ